MLAKHILVVSISWYLARCRVCKRLMLVLSRLLIQCWSTLALCLRTGASIVTRTRRPTPHIDHRRATDTTKRPGPKGKYLRGNASSRAANEPSQYSEPFPCSISSAARANKVLGGYPVQARAPQRHVSPTYVLVRYRPYSPFAARMPLLR